MVHVHIALKLINYALPCGNGRSEKKNCPEETGMKVNFLYLTRVAQKAPLQEENSCIEPFN
jgi:hypothetical protein